jgi:hypothetical protein
MNHSAPQTSVAITAIVVALGIVVGSTALNPFLMITPAYAQLDNISGEQTIGEIEIPDSDAIREKVGEITSSQSVPRLAELGSALLPFRSPPAFAG